MRTPIEEFALRGYSAQMDALWEAMHLPPDDWPELEDKSPALSALEAEQEEALAECAAGFGPL